MAKFEQKQRLSVLLLEFMKANKLSSYGAAESIGVSQGAVQSWVNRSAYPQKEQRERIAAALGFKYEALEAHLENRTIAADSVRTVDAVCQDIRMLPRADLPQVARVLTERLIAEMGIEGVEQR
jgi:transcriptional regulator with XRE-family HTH domain